MSLYVAFFGLQQQPFRPTPDPGFLYLSPGHREALAQVLQGVQERKGFILLTGGIGTGKTTLLRTLLGRLDGDTVSSFIFETTLPFEGLLEYMLKDFGLAEPGESQVQPLIALNQFLIERRRAGQSTVLVLDEAQNLDLHALEQIRLLSNGETRAEKLLQIVLVGQPELLDKLSRPEFRELNQCIALRCRILPLTPEQTRDYVRSRLQIAGANDLGLFTDAAITRIAEHSGGIPRLINALCDHCLLIGYADQLRRIDRTIAEEAVEYFEQGERRRRRVHARRGAAWRPRRAVDLVREARQAIGRIDIVDPLRRFIASLAPRVRLLAVGSWHRWRVFLHVRPRHLRPAATVIFVSLTAFGLFRYQAELDVAVRRWVPSAPASSEAPRPTRTESSESATPPGIPQVSAPATMVAEPPAPAPSTAVRDPRAERPAKQETSKSSQVEPRLERSKNRSPSQRFVASAPPEHKASNAAAAPAPSASRDTRPALDVVGRLQVKSRSEAERDVVALLAKAGGAAVSRQRGEKATVIEAEVPNPEYGKFTQGLTRIGAWQIEAGRSQLPDPVRLTVRVTE